MSNDNASGATDFETFLQEQGGDFVFSGDVATDYKLASRIVSGGFGPAITPEEQATLTAKFMRSGPAAGRAGRIEYNGAYLVDDMGRIARKPYYASKDVYAEINSLNSDERLGILALLYSRGFYGKSKPSPKGTMSVDRTAFKEFLNYANTEGYTWRPLLAKVIAMPVTSAGGGGSKYRASAAEDITEYLRTASLEKLGRTMSKADIDKAIASIQQAERTRGPEAPALPVAAAQQVSTLNPDREKAVKFRRAIDVGMSLLGG